MKLGKLNALTQKIIDKTIQEAQTFKPEINASDELKNFFAKVYNENIIDDEDGKIEDLIEAAALKSSGITGRKPAMGLVDEIIDIKKSDVESAKQTQKKEVNEKTNALEDVENKTDKKITKAEDNATSVREESEKNNKIAEQNLNKTKIENSQKINQAKAHEQKVETSANEKMTKVSNNLEDANAQQANATETYNNAVEATNEAAAVAAAAEHSNEMNITETGAEIAPESAEGSDYGDTPIQYLGVEGAKVQGSAKSESDNSTDSTVSQQADQALEQAQAQQAEAKDALDKANEQQKEAETQKAETDAQCKQEMAAAKENTETTKTEGEESIKTAEKNVTNTRAEGEENTKAAEKNVTSTKAEAETEINAAEEGLATTEAENNKNVQDINKEVAEARELADKIKAMALGQDKDGNKVEFDKKEYQNLISSITEKNIAEVLGYGGKDLTDAICGVTSSNTKVQKLAQESSQHIVNKLIAASNKCNEYEYPTLGIEKDFFVNDYPNFFNPNSMSKSDFQECKEKISYFITEQVEEISDAQEQIDLYNDALNINGEYDELAIQKTGNCWAHAGLNTLAQTEVGRKLIKENIYRDAEAGITYVKIPESGKTYEISDRELIDGYSSQSSGDADVTAYTLAMEKFLGSTNGNGVDRVFELFTGKKGENELIKNLTDGALPEGVSWFARAQNENEEWNTLYDSVIKQIQNNQGVVTLNMATGFEKDSNHVISVLGLDSQGRIIAQESNNAEGMAERLCGKGNYQVQRDANGDKRYILHLSKEAFLERCIAVASWRWK